MNPTHRNPQHPRHRIHRRHRHAQAREPSGPGDAGDTRHILVLPPGIRERPLDERHQICIVDAMIDRDRCDDLLRRDAGEKPVIGSKVQKESTHVVRIVDFCTLHTNISVI